MNKKVKILISVILMLVVLIIITPNSQAVGLVIAFSESTANVGDTVTVTVTGTGVTGSVNLSVEGNATLNQKTVWVENNSASTTLKVNGEGNIRVTATASDMADSTTAAAYTGSTGGTITVSNSSTSTSSTSGGSSSNSQTPTKPTTTPNKSNNANLGNLGIRPNDFSGFLPYITEYTTTVPNDVTSVEVYATKLENGQTITGAGTKELQEGENTFEIVVTAPDGTTKKTYTLTVNREASDAEDPAEETPEEGATEASEGFGLSTLKIEGVELTPSFSTDVYEYTAKYTGEDSQLNITATPTEEGANVEIAGNENLVDGENTITILVTDSSGDKTVTYQINLQKQAVDEEALAKQEELEKQQQMRKYIIIGGVAFLIVVLLIIILVVRHRRNMRYAQDYTVPYSGLDDDDYYDNKNKNNDDSYDDEEFKKVTSDFLKKDAADKKVENNAEENEEKDNKEKAKDSYLNQFDNNNLDDDMPRKRHNKGKRFK